MISGLVLSAAVAALLAGRWLDDMARSGLVRENYRGVHPAFPAGAVLIACSLVALAPLAVLDDRADLDLLDPELRRWATTSSASRSSACSTTRSAAARRWTRRAAGAVMPRLWSRAGSRPGPSRPSGALALAAYAVSGRGRENVDYVADLALLLLATNLFNLLDLRPGRVEKAFILLLAGLCLAGWTAVPVELLGLFVGPVLVGAWFTLRERAMLGDTGSNLVGALAGISMLVVLGDEARLVALAIVAGLTIYGEFRSISSVIDRFPPLRRLDSLGRVSEGSTKR